MEYFYAYEWPTWMPATSMVPAPAVWPDGETDRAIRGRGPVRGMLLGSVSQHLLHHCAGTVAVVREIASE